jgi:hypothetical protein
MHKCAFVGIERIILSDMHGKTTIKTKTLLDFK